MDVFRHFKVNQNIRNSFWSMTLENEHCIKPLFAHCGPSKYQLCGGTRNLIQGCTYNINVVHTSSKYQTPRTRYVL